MQQKLSQIQGVGQVNVGGASLPSVRVEVNPTQLNHYGLTMASIQRLLSLQNSDIARGQISDGTITADIITNDQISHADDYKPLIVGYHNGPAVHLSDVADVQDSAQNIRTAGYLNGIPSVTVIIFRQPGANIIETDNRIRAQLPFLAGGDAPGHQDHHCSGPHHDHPRLGARRRALADHLGRAGHPGGLHLPAQRPRHPHPQRRRACLAHRHLRRHVSARLQSRQSLADGADHLHRLRRGRRHRGDGEHLPPSRNGHGAVEAALKGAKEIGFTVLSISMSLIAVFIPLLLMGGIVGRLFREFAITLSTAILVSMVISLTTTPMMCAHCSRPTTARNMAASTAPASASSTGCCRLPPLPAWVLDNPGLMLVVLLLTIALNVVLIIKIPKGFFPQQDTGAMAGGVQGPQDASFR